MPELPEVEVVCRGLAPLVTNKKIVAVSFSNKKLRKPFPRAMIDQYVEKAFIIGVERRAKFILLRLTNQHLLVFHLGMTGKLGVFPQDSPRRKHDHVRLILENNKEIRFNDARRFGCVEFFSARELAKGDPFAHLGPEPFSAEFSAEYLLTKAQSRSQPVKNFLMDNYVVVGIGNIYANETLFAARTHPLTPVNSLLKMDWQLIIKKSRAILEKAIQSGGTTISDYENASGKPGYFQLELKVYGRSGQPCSICQTAIVRSVTGGRATYYCPNCQPLPQ
ncbi:MAG: bifunctional DNA-formamidopyrimidine glycosylase/DNA-(apurinic or apyrimidinic site) lyase [Desulfobulbaceae bacterium]|nr:bifunctional DNA-formamidopyrimidine glycosylase/DNA-(apurinic or apyrimidinic site) lyase [Desulfobulbaceae bacterium]